MKLSDIGRYYKSTQGIYLSDSGGRRVVDKMADLSLNRAHAEWSGTDRPEYTDFDGAKVCVEAERTNRVYNSDTSTASLGRSVRVGTESRLGIEGALYSVEEGQSNPLIRVNPPNTLDFIAGKEYSFSAFVATDNSDFFSMRIGFSGSALTGLVADFTPSTQSWVVSVNNANIIDHHVRHEYIGEGIYRLHGTIILEEDEEALYCWLYFGDNHNVWTGGWQVENAPYSTNLIPTSGSPVTRLAPTVPIEDALPLTGTVAGVVDLVATDQTQAIFDSGGSRTTDMSRFFIDNVGRVTVRIFGEDGGHISLRVMGFSSWGDFSRRTFAYQATWSDSLLCMRILHDNGQIYEVSATHAINDDSNRTIELCSEGSGLAKTSMRFEVPWHKDEIDRTGATDDEIKAFFEFLTLGTSMQMTADEMEIVS